MMDIKQRYRSLAQVIPQDATPRMVGLEVALSTSTTSDSARYTVSAEKVYFITQVQAYHRFSTANSEATVAAALGTNLGPWDRAYLKLQNAVWSLKDTERTETDIVKGSSPTLAAIAPEVNGRPIDLSGSPIVIPGGSTIEATITLKDTTAAVVGGTSTYGLQLSGVLLPRVQ